MTPKNIHKIFIPKKIHVSEDPKNIEIQNFEPPKKWPEPMYVWKYESTPWGIYIPIQDTVVCWQANRRPDVMRQIVYKDEEQDRT